jgi:hypothetical protein
MKIKSLLFGLFFSFASFMSFASESVEKPSLPLVNCPGSIQVLLSCGTAYEQCNGQNMTMQQLIDSILQAEEDYCG